MKQKSNHRLPQTALMACVAFVLTFYAMGFDCRCFGAMCCDQSSCCAHDRQVSGEQGDIVGRNTTCQCEPAVNYASAVEPRALKPTPPRQSNQMSTVNLASTTLSKNRRMYEATADQTDAEGLCAQTSFCVWRL